MIFALLLLQFKHFACDFPLQTPYQVRNKGRYGHPGGLTHAGLHALGTAAVCAAAGLPAWFALADGVVHYHVDWAKSRLSVRWRLTPAIESFWWLLGLDQLLHQLTYLALVAAA